jgi:hypothetical protein
LAPGQGHKPHRNEPRLPAAWFWTTTFRVAAGSVPLALAARGLRDFRIFGSGEGVQNRPSTQFGWGSWIRIELFASTRHQRFD